LVLAFVAQGCGTEAPKDTRAADESAIRANSTAWSSASQTKNLDKVVSFYAPDAIAMPDDTPIATTASDIRAMWQGMFSNANSTLSWKTTKVEVAKSSDIAYEYGVYHIDTPQKSGLIDTVYGKYLVIWKKQADGTWKVAVDTDNNDAPPAPAPPAHPAHHAAAKKHHRHH
jgi:uncharacterized protein (TIGR02246 family)